MSIPKLKTVGTLSLGVYAGYKFAFSKHSSIRSESKLVRYGLPLTASASSIIAYLMSPEYRRHPYLLVVGIAAPIVSVVEFFSENYSKIKEKWLAALAAGLFAVDVIGLSEEVDL